MAFFMAFPYTDLYQLNLDWVLETLKRLENTVGEEVVNTFNTRSGNVELNADDVNALMIELVYVGNPGEDITDITPAELQQMYDSGKRLLLLKDSDGVPRDLYVLDIVGETATATKYIPFTSGDVVTSFNNRSGAVALLASDVNATRIDITWISDPGDDITDLSQTVIDEMFNDGVRALIFINNDGNPEQLYFLSLVGDVVTPVKSDSGVISVNNKTGVVVLFGTDIALRTGVAETVDGAVTSIRNNMGALSALSTDVKTSLVAAINEVDGHADNAAYAAAAAQTTANNAVTAAENVASDLGDTSDLDTTVKTDVVAAINEVNGKTVNLGPINNLTSDSITAALAAAQGKILDNKLFGAMGTEMSASGYTDTWLLSAKNGAYKVRGDTARGSFLDGVDSTYGILFVFSSFPNNHPPINEEYGIIIFANSTNSLYYRNFYRQINSNTITWRGPLQKITAI